MNTPETSSEILDDVLKQLDKLSPEKRKKILDRLIAASLIDSDSKTTTERINSSTRMAYTEKTTEMSQDEVKILDLHKPKMSVHHKKRRTYK